MKSFLLFPINLFVLIVYCTALLTGGALMVIAMMLSTAYQKLNRSGGK